MRIVAVEGEYLKVEVDIIKECKECNHWGKVSRPNDRKALRRSRVWPTTPDARTH